MTATIGDSNDYEGGGATATATVRDPDTRGEIVGVTAAVEETPDDTTQDVTITWTIIAAGAPSATASSSDSAAPAATSGAGAASSADRTERSRPVPASDSNSGASDSNSGASDSNSGASDSNSGASDSAASGATRQQNAGVTGYALYARTGATYTLRAAWPTLGPGDTATDAGLTATCSATTCDTTTPPPWPSARPSPTPWTH